MGDIRDRNLLHLGGYHQASSHALELCGADDDERGGWLKMWMMWNVCGEMRVIQWTPCQRGRGDRPLRRSSHLIFMTKTTYP